MDLDKVVRNMENLNTLARAITAPRSGKITTHPRGSYIVIPIAVFGVTTPENKVYIIGGVIHSQEVRYKVPKSGLRTVLKNMQFALHATRRRPQRVSRFVQAMSAWLLKPWTGCDSLFLWFFYSRRRKHFRVRQFRPG